LQAIVSRSVEIREVVDEAEIGEVSAKRSHARNGISLIEINDTGKLRPMVANVGDVQTKLAGESMLDASVQFST